MNRARIAPIAPIDRRTILRGACGATLGLPWLEAMAPRKALAADANPLPAAFYSRDGFPKRLLVVYTPNGVVMDRWKVTGTDTNFTLSPTLQPLAPFRSKLVVTSGIYNIGAARGPGDLHQNGMGALLTGTRLSSERLFGHTEVGFPLVGWAGGISVDQAVADRVGQQTRLRSLELGVQVPVATNWSRMSYRGANQPVAPENSPFAAFDRVFGDAKTAGADNLVPKRRRLVLDAVRESYRVLVPKLGVADRRKLEAHLASVDDVAGQLDRTAAQTPGACSPPEVGPSFAVTAPEKFPDIARLQGKLLAQAFACDATRVGSIMFDRARGEKLYGWLGHTRTHHDMSHSGDSDVETMGKLAAINRWHAEEVAHLLGELDRVKEGAGTVLDHTLVFWCTDVTLGNSHDPGNAPYLLAGGCGGAIRTGRAVTFRDARNNDLLVSILNAMGIEQSTFGERDFCRGPLVGLS